MVRFKLGAGISTLHLQSLHSQLETLMTLGHLLKDAESVVLAWGTGGIWLTTHEAIANTTSAGNDAPWDVTRHTYLNSIAVARFALVAAYLFVTLRKLITNPEEVRVLLPPLALPSPPLPWLTSASIAAATTATLTCNHPSQCLESAQS